MLHLLNNHVYKTTAKEMGHNSNSSKFVHRHDKFSRTFLHVPVHFAYTFIHALTELYLITQVILSALPYHDLFEGKDWTRPTANIMH